MGMILSPEPYERGAIAVVGERPKSAVDVPVPYFSVANARLAWAYLSARQYNFPSRQLTMIGVTGTDGKTTTVNLIFEILKAAGLRVGMISTVNAVVRRSGRGDWLACNHP